LCCHEGYAPANSKNVTATNLTRSEATGQNESLLYSTNVLDDVTDFGTKITELQRTVELNAQDVELLDDVGFTTAFDIREEQSVLVACDHSSVIRLTEQFDVVEYVGDDYANGTEVKVGDEQ